MGTERQNADGSWSPAEPMGWQEEHDWLQRLIFWVRRIPHCNDEAQRRLVNRHDERANQDDSLARVERDDTLETDHSARQRLCPGDGCTGCYGCRAPYPERASADREDARVTAPTEAHP